MFRVNLNIKNIQSNYNPTKNKTMLVVVSIIIMVNHTTSPSSDPSNKPIDT